jgi:hypothetical protein
MVKIGQLHANRNDTSERTGTRVTCRRGQQIPPLKGNRSTSRALPRRFGRAPPSISRHKFSSLILWYLYQYSEYIHRRSFAEFCQGWQLPFCRQLVIWELPPGIGVDLARSFIRPNVSGPDYRPLSRYTKRQWLLNSYCSVPQVVYMLIMGTQVSQ